MSSVTQRVNQIKQPRGGYIKPSEFEVVEIVDKTKLNEDENIHASVIGMVVDYLTRYCLGADIVKAFYISLEGALIAEKLGMKQAKKTAIMLASGIQGLDDKSIINACKLATFDVWFRNTINAFNVKSYKDTNPDKKTIQNIRTMVQRSMRFFSNYGPIVSDGFTFGPIDEDNEKYEKMIKTKKGTYGGYTSVVDAGDGDFLTKDTLWDFKVSKSKPKSIHTLQLLMYWIMGQHSGQEIFKNITKIGIFNPRLNTVYLLDMNNVSEEVIKTVEKEVICY